MKHHMLAVIVALALVVAVPIPSAIGANDEKPTAPVFGSHATESTLTILGDLYRRDEHVRRTPAARALPVLRQYTHAELCNVSSATLTSDIEGSCAPADGAAPAPACDPGPPIMPLWRRDRSTEAAPWGPWTFATGWACPQDALPTFTAEDFRQLPITPQIVFERRTQAQAKIE